MMITTCGLVSDLQLFLLLLHSLSVLQTLTISAQGHHVLFGFHKEIEHNTDRITWLMSLELQIFTKVAGMHQNQFIFRLNCDEPMDTQKSDFFLFVNTLIWQLICSRSNNSSANNLNPKWTKLQFNSFTMLVKFFNLKIRTSGNFASINCIQWATDYICCLSHHYWVQNKKDAIKRCCIHGNVVETLKRHI